MCILSIVQARVRCFTVKQQCQTTEQSKAAILTLKTKSLILPNTAEEMWKGSITLCNHSFFLFVRWYEVTGDVSLQLKERCSEFPLMLKCVYVIQSITVLQTVSFCFLSHGGTCLKKSQHNWKVLDFFFFPTFFLCVFYCNISPESLFPSWLRSLDHLGPSPRMCGLLHHYPPSPLTSSVLKPDPEESALTSEVWTTRCFGGPWTGYQGPDSANCETATPTSP